MIKENNMGLIKSMLIEIDEAIEAGTERWDAVSDAIERWDLDPEGTIAKDLERIYITENQYQDDADSDIPQRELH
jgi:hypothetical protein